MSKSITIELAGPAFAYAENKAKEFGLSVKEWIETELEWQSRMELEADWIFAERTDHSKPGTLSEILAKVPDVPPMPGDELPEPRRV